MKLGWNAVQTKVFETLSADPAVSALVGSRIFATLQDPPYTFPLIILGSWESAASLDKPGTQESVLTIHALSTQRGNQELNSILEAVVAALIGVQLQPAGIGKTVGRYAGAVSDVEEWDTGETVQSGYVQIGWLIW